MVQQQSDGMLFWWFNMYGKDLFLPEKLDDGEEVTGSLQHHYLSLQVLQNRFWMFWTFFDVFCMTSYVSMCDLVQCLCFPTGQVLLHCICCALKEYEDDPNVAARPTRRNGSFRKWGCIKHDHIIYRMYPNVHEHTFVGCAMARNTGNDMRLEVFSLPIWIYFRIYRYT